MGDTISIGIIDRYFGFWYQVSVSLSATLKDIGAFSFLELNKGIIQMQVTIKLTR